MEEFLMKILMFAAIAVASLAAVQSVMAADLNVERRPYYSERTRHVYGVGPTFWRAQPADILYKYAPEYPGWRGDSYYYDCRSVQVRETLPDGSIVIRRGRDC